MSCVKSYVYPISQNEGGLAGIFFGHGKNDDENNVKYYIDVNILGGDGNFHPVKVIADSVTGDSMLYWKEDNELKFGSMEDLYCSYIANKDNKDFKVNSIKSKTNNKLTANSAQPYFAKIKDVSYHGIKPVHKITLRNGKSVKITKDHSIFGSQSYHTELKAKSFNNLKNVLSVDNYEIKDTKPISIDNDMLTFMGLWIADGSYSKQNNNSSLSGVRISTGNEQNIVSWLNDFSNNINNGNGTCLKYSKTRLGDISIHRKSLGDYIYSLFGEVDSFTKRVPKEIFISTDEQIAAFLKGYFSGDGSIHLCNDNPKCSNFKYGKYYAVDCTSVNRQLLEDISILLDRLGIKHNISTPFKQSKSGYKSNQLFYKLIIHAATSVKKFVEKIGFIKKFEYKDRESYSKDKMLRPVSLRQIRNVEYIGLEPVYDISVEETENFIVNGILCHNTGNDVTLLTKATADYLSLNPAFGNLLEVSGIREGMVSRFKRIKTHIQLGNLRPIIAEIGFAVDRDSLQENLLGNKGILGSGQFEFIYKKNSLTIVDNVNSCGATSGMYAARMKHNGVSYFSRRYFV